MPKTETTTQHLPAVRSFGEMAQFEEFEQILLSGERIEQTAMDPEEASRAVLEQILASDSDAALFRSQKAIGWRDLLGLPIELTDYPAWRPSTFEEGSNVFFVVFGRRMDTGDNVILTTGARNVLAQLVNMAKRKVLVGAIVQLVEAEKPTKQGYRPLWLELVKSAENDTDDAA